jgi:hypothetical protein
MVEALNTAAVELCEDVDSSPFAIGFMGDDHRPRTIGWHVMYMSALLGMRMGIVYGDDTIQHDRIPTQCMMTADIVRALGYMAPPSLTHLYVDNAWLAIGRACGMIRYLPGVVVQHLHPVAGTAEVDEGYKRANSASMYQRDANAYSEYVRENLLRDIEKIHAAQLKL